MLALFYYNKEKFDLLESDYDIKEVMVKEIDNEIVSFFTVTSNYKYQIIYNNLLSKLPRLESVCVSNNSEKHLLTMVNSVKNYDKKLYSMSMEEFNNEENMSILFSFKKIDIVGIETFKEKIEVYFYFMNNALIYNLNPYNALSFRCHDKYEYAIWLRCILDTPHLRKFYEDNNVYLIETNILNAIALQCTLVTCADSIQEVSYNNHFIFRIHSKSGDIKHLLNSYSVSK